MLFRSQWLMTSRFYLGEDVPNYRDVLALPPLVPLALAGVRVLIGDPQIALQIVTLATLAGLAASFYLFGSHVLHSRVAGALSVAFALLVTDRFLELLAFGAKFARRKGSPQVERVAITEPIFVQINEL